MSTLSKTFHALYGTYRLARFDAGAMQYFDDSRTGFWHSFQAALWVFPLYLITVMARWGRVGTEVPELHFILVELIAYVIAWTAYPVILPYVARAFGREQNYKRSVVAYNWASILQNLIYTPIAIVSLTGSSGAGLLTLIAFFSILAYSWFVTKTSLDISPSQAWIVVSIDILISMVLSLWVDNLFVAG